MCVATFLLLVVSLLVAFFSASAARAEMPLIRKKQRINTLLFLVLLI